jgi:hypothetical protein
MGPRDDNIDLLRSSLDGAADFGYTLGQGGKSCGKSGGNGCNSHAAILERPTCDFHEPVIHANRCNLDFELFNSQPFYQFVLDGLQGLGTQATHALVGVVAREGGEIHASNCAEQPGRLPVFFHGTARDVTLSPPFDRTGVHANLSYAIEIEWYAPIGQKRAAAQDC